jgi:hypothetical protein
VYPILPVSLNCQFLISPSVFSNVYLDLLVVLFLTFSVKYVITTRINSTICKDETEMKERNRNTDHHSWLITGFVTRLTRRVRLVEQKLPTLPEHLSSPPVLVGFCYSVFNFMCMFCRSFFVFMYFSFWPLCCLFFFDLRIVITPFGIFKLFLTTSG